MFLYEATIRGPGKAQEELTEKWKNASFSIITALI